MSSRTRVRFGPAPAERVASTAGGAGWARPGFRRLRAAPCRGSGWGGKEVFEKGHTRSRPNHQSGHTYTRARFVLVHRTISSHRAPRAMPVAMAKLNMAALGARAALRSSLQLELFLKKRTVVSERAARGCHARYGRGDRSRRQAHHHWQGGEGLTGCDSVPGLIVVVTVRPPPGRSQARRDRRRVRAPAGGRTRRPPSDALSARSARGGCRWLAATRGVAGRRRSRCWQTVRAARYIHPSNQDR